MQPYEPRPQGLLGNQNGVLEKLVGPDRPDHYFECREDPGEEVGSLMTESRAQSPQALCQWLVTERNSGIMFFFFK